MTNKEKYPNACVKENPHATEACDGKWYIALSKKDFQFEYLLRNLQVGPHDSNNPRNTYHPSKEAAQLSLDNFMNEKKSVTLDEIKSQLSEAKKLIGKKFSNSHDQSICTCDRVFIALERGGETSPLMDKEIKEIGYSIGVKATGMGTYPFSMCKPVSTVEVTNHHGEKYTAQDNSQTWKFGCAEISKSLVKELYETMSKTHTGNRQASKVTIGAADFDVDTLKALVELEEQSNRNSPNGYSERMQPYLVGNQKMPEIPATKGNYAS